MRFALTMDFRVHHSAVTESTNSDARAGAPGDVYTADAQTAGRGRLDHRWHSAPGENLIMSAVLDVAGIPPEQIATFPLVVGLAVHDAMAEILAESGDVPPVMIKWPNDVLVGGLKISGILCERHGDAVIAGVGVNVNQREFPPDVAGRATSLALLRPGAAPFSVPAVRDAVLDRLGALYATWRCGGFAALHPRYAALDVLKGRRISVRQTDDDAAPTTGVCAGVCADGTLRVGDVCISAGEAHVLPRPL